LVAAVDAADAEVSFPCTLIVATNRVAGNGTNQGLNLEGVVVISAALRVDTTNIDQARQIYCNALDLMSIAEYALAITWHSKFVDGPALLDAAHFKYVSSVSELTLSSFDLIGQRELERKIRDGVLSCVQCLASTPRHALVLTCSPGNLSELWANISKCLVVSANVLEQLKIEQPCRPSHIADVGRFKAVAPYRFPLGSELYDFGVCLGALLIERKIKFNDDTLVHLLSNGVAIAFGHTVAAKFKADVLSGAARIPGRNTVQKWAIKMDLILTL
jgi:hypothetical protein